MYHFALKLWPIIFKAQSRTSSFIHLGYNEEVKQMVLAAGLTGDQFVSLKQKLNMLGLTLRTVPFRITDQTWATDHKGADARDTITVGFSH